MITRWSVPATCERAWHEITHPLDWPRWWPGVEAVQKIRDGVDADGLGSIHRSTWKSRLPYRLTFETESIHVERFKVYVVRATGQLQGEGRWTFSESHNQTSICYEWNVDATKLWMRIGSPILKPLFRWNHDTIMRWGGVALARRLSECP